MTKLLFEMNDWFSFFMWKYSWRFDWIYKNRIFGDRELSMSFKMNVKINSKQWCNCWLLEKIDVNVAMNYELTMQYVFNCCKCDIYSLAVLWNVNFCLNCLPPKIEHGYERVQNGQMKHMYAHWFNVNFQNTTSNENISLQNVGVDIC